MEVEVMAAHDYDVDMAPKKRTKRKKPAQPEGPVIGFLRRERGITQAQLARKLGVITPTVSTMEGTNSRPTLSSKVRYLNALGYTMKDFEKAKLKLYGPAEESVPRAEPGEIPDEFEGLGPWIGLVREHRGIEQSVLAVLAGETMFVWQSFEAGQQGVRTDRLGPVLSRLGVTLKDYVESQGTEGQEVELLRQEVDILRGQMTHFIEKLQRLEIAEKLEDPDEPEESAESA